ncbi:Hint domain-containing protein [Asaia krungthepensis]|nr:Hint domain-containing protein [Asaia krungthepensis]
MLDAPWGDVQSGTAMVNNPVYVVGQFSIKVNPAENSASTITYTGSGGTLINLIPNGEDHGVIIRITANYFDIPNQYLNQPIPLASITDYMGPYASEIDLEACYLPGTLIETPSGDMPIERLKAGDEVIVHDELTSGVRTIRAVGCGQANVMANLPDDIAGWPIRVRKSALADNVPFKDMLLTAEHCLYLQGAFVPVRMLVNGRSIYYDKTIRSYNYYHLETEPHSIIRADGALSETLMDAGHGGRLYNASLTLPPRLTTDWSQAAAPLRTSRKFVEPLHQQFEDRAASFSDTVDRLSTETTEDNGLYLLTEKGRRIDGYGGKGAFIHFSLPNDVQSLYLMSRASRPCDAIGPFIDDRRLLGVLVGSVTLDEGGVSTRLTTHLESETLPGWEKEIAGTMRWTRGNALLPLPARVHEGIRRLSVEILDGGPYVVHNDLPVVRGRCA